MDKANVDGLFNNGQGLQAFGSVAERLVANGMDANALRPWVEDDKSRSDYGRSFITTNGKRVPIANATLLRKDEWKDYDKKAIEIARQRLIGINDLISRGLTYNISNGMGKTVLEYEDVSDIQGAEISMDAVTPGKRDRPKYGISYLPLPIVHKDFQVNARVLAASRTTGTPLDTTLAGMAARKVAELLEEMLFTDLTYTKLVRQIGDLDGIVYFTDPDFGKKKKLVLSRHLDRLRKQDDEVLEDQDRWNWLKTNYF